MANSINAIKYTIKRRQENGRSNYNYLLVSLPTFFTAINNRPTVKYEWNEKETLKPRASMVKRTKEQRADRRNKRKISWCN